LIATNTLCNRPHRTVSYAVPAHLLYAVRNSLYSLITQKISVGQTFRKGKIVSKFKNTSLQGHGVVLNHPYKHKFERLFLIYWHNSPQRSKTFYKHAFSKIYIHTRSIPKVSDLHLYLRAKVSLATFTGQERQQ